jgi:hypothetical protein
MSAALSAVAAIAVGRTPQLGVVRVDRFDVDERHGGLLVGGEGRVPDDTRRGFTVMVNQPREGVVPAGVKRSPA